MTAGATGTISTNPLWVVKTRFMVCPLSPHPPCDILITIPNPLSKLLRYCFSTSFSVHLASVDLGSRTSADRQAQAVLSPSEHRYRNTFDAIATIYRQEGFRAFYKGLLPSLMGVTHVAVQFPLYEAFKSWAGTSYTLLYARHSYLSPASLSMGN